MKKALLFESKTCTRCYGSGRFSYNQRDGHVCFGCSGRGVQLTKRGAVAQAFYTASVTVAVPDLQVGDVVFANGITMGGSTYQHQARVLEIGELHEYGKSLVAGEWVPNIGRTLVLADVKSGEESRVIGPDTMTFRKVWGADETATKRDAALAYQATLTATGTVRKRA